MALGRRDTGKVDDGGFAALKQRIKRGDAVVVEDAAKDTVVVNTTPTKANLLQVKKPHYITAVGLPANETGFKVVREDRSKPDGKSVSHPILRRTRRADTNPVLRLTFPEGVDEETVTTALKTYGLEGYRVEQQGGVFVATRADLKSITKSKTTDIALTEDGLVATVARADGGVSSQEPKPGLILSSVEFDSTKFTLEEVKRWTLDKCVDGEVQEPQNPDECYVVRRSDVPDNEETRRMVLEDGVQAVVVRSDVMDVPDGYAAVVNETAYGSWGWGHLDFSAALGDRPFNEAMFEAFVSLDDVLRGIVLHSPLPLDMRKELANRALAQYGDYIGNVMDSLPRQLLASVVRSSNHTQQEKVMTTEISNADNKPAQPPMPSPMKPKDREPDVLPEKQSPTSPATDPKVKPSPKLEASVSRADVEQMIDEAVAKALATQATPAVETTLTAEPAKTDSVSRADFESAMAAIVAPMTDAIKALQGTTVVRSAPEPVPEKGDGKPKDVFRGAAVFSGLRSVRHN